MGGKDRQIIAWQRLEGLFIASLGLVLYLSQSSNIWPFFALLLVPDISMAGYLINKRVGAFVYNLGHALVFPLIILLLSVWSNETWLLYAAGIWMAHIGLDRMMGYGLKYNDGFGHTHLGIIGKSAK